MEDTSEWEHARALKVQSKAFSDTASVCEGIAGKER